MKDRERERARLRGALDDCGAIEQVSGLDLDSVRARLESTLVDWRGLLGRHPQQARAIPAKMLSGRLVFTLQTGAATGTRSYVFAGEGRLEALLSGALSLPRAFVTPAGFEPAISTLKGSRPWPG